MAFTVVQTEQDGDHKWAAVHCSCDLADAGDPLVSATVQMVREAYGELLLLARLAPDPSVSRTFNTEAVLKAFRMGLPDPSVEIASKKPVHLSNYRSETVEIVARGALKEAFGITFPTHPQRGKTNQNQPVLGFDGWGVAESPEHQYALVLVQVKGTEDDSCPPREAKVLAAEVDEVLSKIGSICRALCIMVVDLEPSELADALLQMLEDLGNGIVPVLLVAPVVVRGESVATLNDLSPIRPASHRLVPSAARGVAVSLGVPLTDFGKHVMSLARAA